jgi:hypothetical protein
LQPAVARKRYVGGHERCLRTGTLAHHGWLTPAALDCKPDERCTSAFPAGASVGGCAFLHHGWLTPAALGARCSFAAKALFAMDKRTFTGAAGVSPPWLGERDAVPRESNIVQRLASTRSGAAGVSPPWLAEMHLHGRYRKHAENCYRWVGRRRCHRGRSVRGSTRTMRSNTAKRHCRPGRLPSHGGLTPPAPGCTCVCTSQKSPFHRHTFRPYQERGSDAGGDVAANNVLRFESGGH